MHGKKNPIGMVACLLAVIGGLNWGLVGLGMLAGVPGGWNVVNMLLGSWPVVEAAVYLLVGLAAAYKLIMCFTRGCCCGCCGGCKNCGPAGAHCAGCADKCDGNCGCHKDMGTMDKDMGGMGDKKMM